MEKLENKSEGKYRLMFENMINGIAYHKIITDKEGKPVDYIFLEINSAFEELTGLKGKQIIGKKVTEALPDIEKDSTDWIGLYGDIALNENSINFENYAEPLNKWYSINAYSPQKGYFITIFEDITERKQAEKELHQSIEREQNLANIVRTTPVAIAFGYPDGRLDNCNQAFSALTGYSEEELKRINWNEVLTPEKWNTIESEELKKLSPENNSIRYEKEYMHKNGNIIPIELTVSAEFDANNKLLNYIGFISDISERKRAKEELEKYRDHLEELVKERTQEVDEKNQKLSDQMKIFVGREIKIRDLEAKIKVLQGE